MRNRVRYVTDRLRPPTLASGRSILPLRRANEPPQNSSQHGSQADSQDGHQVRSQATPQHGVRIGSQYFSKYGTPLNSRNGALITSQFLSKGPRPIKEQAKFRTARHKSANTTRRNGIRTVTGIGTTFLAKLLPRAAHATPIDPEHLELCRLVSEELTSLELTHIRLRREAQLALNHLRLCDFTSSVAHEMQYDASFASLSWSLQGELPDKLDLDWLRNYAALFSRRPLGSEALEPVIRSSSRRRFMHFVKLLRASKHRTTQHRVQGAVRGHFHAMQKDFEDYWPEAMLLTMRYMPGLAIYVLQASFLRVKPPFYMVADMLHFIVRFCLSDPKELRSTGSAVSLSEQPGATQMIEMILDLVSQYKHQKAHIYGETINLLLHEVELDYGYALFYGLRAHESRLSIYSCNVFARYFATKGEYETALEAMEMYISAGGAPDDSQFQKTASLLLRKSMLHPHGYQSNSLIISKFVEMGLHIGVSFQKTLIANAFKSKDERSALNVFSVMREQALEPDADTYSNLLMGLRSSDNQELIDDILDLSWAKVEESRDSHLANELLYWRYVRYKSRADSTWNLEEKSKIHHEGMRSVVSLFTAIFDKRPLEVLGFARLIPPEHWNTLSLNLKPQPFAMTILLLAYTRAMVFVAEDEDTSNVGTNVNVFRSWLRIAKTGHLYNNVEDWIPRLFLDMMKTSHALNIFMHAMGAQVGTLPYAPEILQLMEKGAIEIIAQDEEENYLEQIAAPNVVSWNVLLNSFARHGNTEAAEKCMQTMQEKKIPMDNITWTTLVKAYAVSQDIQGVGDALRRKTEAGFGMDDDIGQRLLRIKDRNALKSVLQREIIANATDVSDAALLGRPELPSAESDKHKTRKWRPDEKQTVGYEPGVGRRPVNYFDANRTSGLHGTTEIFNEDSDFSDPPTDKPAANMVRRVRTDASNVRRVLTDRGSFTLKSEDPEDWFEKDEDEDENEDDVFGKDGKTDGFTDSFMDTTTRGE